MTSDYRHARQGTTSSAAGSDMMNFSDHKLAHETVSRVKTTQKKSPPIDAESLGDSVTDIPNQNTDLKQVSFEQQHEHQEVSPVSLNVPPDDHHEAYFVNAQTKHETRIKEFDT